MNKIGKAISAAVLTLTTMPFLLLGLIVLLALLIFLIASISGIEIMPIPD